MKLLLILWAGPVLLLGSWYGLSYYDMSFGFFMLTRQTHDLVFQVYGDGKLLTEAKSVYGEASKILSADISGVKVVELVARADNRTSDLPLIVTWGEASLRR